MKDFFSLLNCCNKKNINEIIVSVIDSKETGNSNTEKLNKGNPFIQTSDSTKGNFISPRFIGNGIIINENENISSKISQKTNSKKSLISFSNFPINIVQIDNNEKNRNIGPKLLCSGELFFNKEIIINSNGMIDGLRQKNDGQVFFGNKIVSDYRGISYNDFIINFQFNDEKEKKSSTGRIFNIYYQKRTNDYYLHLIHDSIIMYYDINNLVYFDNEKDYYLLIGNVFITVVTKKIGNKKGIDIEVENEDGKNNFFNFTEDETPISIGRSNCKIYIPKESISKFHGEFGFSKETQKFFYKDCKSTNGSTLLIKEDDNLLIQGEMNFRLENIPFTIFNLP